MSNPRTTEYLEPIRVGEQFGVSSFTARRWMKAEGLVCYRVAGRLVTTQGDLDEWSNREETREMLAKGRAIKAWRAAYHARQAATA
jgi:hypothetical protein